MSAYAMWMGLRGDWPIDVHRLSLPAREATEATFGEGETLKESYREPARAYETLVFPAGAVSFFWPPDERAAIMDAPCSSAPAR